MPIPQDSFVYISSLVCSACFMSSEVLCSFAVVCFMSPAGTQVKTGLSWFAPRRWLMDRCPSYWQGVQALWGWLPGWWEASCFWVSTFTNYSGQISRIVWGSNHGAVLLAGWSCECLQVHLWMYGCDAGCWLWLLSESDIWWALGGWKRCNRLTDWDRQIQTDNRGYAIARRGRAASAQQSLRKEIERAPCLQLACKSYHLHDSIMIM